MSDTVFKANRINIKSEGKKVIDSNESVAQRLQMIAEILEKQNMPTEADFTEGFIEGLDATQVEMLLADPSEGEYYDGEYQDESGGMAAGDMSQVLSGANAQIQQMLDDARLQADEIINSARAEAESIIAAATGESEGIRSRASEDGYQQGFEKGHEEGLAQIAAMEEELKNRAEEMERELEAQIDALEPLFVENITDIYSHIFNVELSSYKGLVTHLIKNTIRGIDGTKSYFVHVSQADYQNVYDAREELLLGLGSSIALEIISDMTLRESECFIEADSGIFDCGLGTELELLKKELVLLSYQKEN